MAKEATEPTRIVCVGSIARGVAALASWTASRSKRNVNVESRGDWLGKTVTFQTPKTTHNKRSDHIWFWNSRHYICVLCGALTDKPPDFPTPKCWMPTKYMPLTDEERLMAPYESHVTR